MSASISNKSENVSVHSPDKMHEKSEYDQINLNGIRICCISLNSKDTIRLIGVPQDLIYRFREAISNSWGRITMEQSRYGSHEFKLSGTPWDSTGDEAVRSRKLLTAIFVFMIENGWQIIQAVDASKQYNDKDALFFEYTQPDPDVRMFAISFNKGDRIRLIGAPENMKQVLKIAVTANAKMEIRHEKDYYGSYELKLSGEPWYCTSGEAGINTKLLMCQILANFKSIGFKLYAAVGISESNELDSWVFRKEALPFCP